MFKPFSKQFKKISTQVMSNLFPASFYFIKTSARMVFNDTRSFFPRAVGSSSSLNSYLLNSERFQGKCRWWC